MARFNKSLIVACVLSLTAASWAAIPWPMWEFEQDGNLEGWIRTGNGHITDLEVRDGKLVLGIIASAGDPYISSPQGPYNADDVTGFYAKMWHSTEPSGGGREFFMFPTSGPFKNIGWEPPTVDPCDGVVYVNLYGEDRPEEWKDEIGTIRFDFTNIPVAYTVEIDWIRPEGLFIENESMEYWDSVNDKILGWEIVGDEANFNFDEQTTVNTRVYSLGLTGNGTKQGVSQAVKGGADLEVDTEIVVMAAINIPTDAWDANSKVTVRVREETTGGEQVSEVDVDVAATDDWVEFASDAIKLQVEATARTDTLVEVLVTSPAGKVVYLDTFFVNAVAPPKTPGWPVNCVKLAEGQEIVIDGVVTPEEYRGAQAMVINAETAWNMEDPYTPRYLHQMLEGNWDNTATDDFSATYYTMWDDTNLYVAVSCEDDNFRFAGPNANDGDALQFTITATANERNYDGKMYIPTIAPRDPSSGQAVAQNNLPGPFIQTDLFAHEGTQYAGSVDDDTQDWMAEVKIPWAAMQADFPPDAFPPSLFDQIGFSVITIDYDVDYDGNPELQSISSTHPGDWPWSPWPWSSGDTQETMTFIE
jgi:Carbohydrate family 9 binding domain-like